MHAIYMHGGAVDVFRISGLAVSTDHRAVAFLDAARRDDRRPQEPQLTRLVSLTNGIDPAGLGANPMELPDTDLYPSPHSPLFDFERTAAGARWIDEIAAAVRAAMTADDALITHGDWSARNIRLGSAGLICAYDWESLRFGPESAAVGFAAATWQSLGELNEPMASSANEIERFIHLYESERDHSFSIHQRRTARAAALYALAYTARCEHALHPDTRRGRASGRLAHNDGLRSLIS